MARALASATIDFQSVKGPGAGDHATGAFMRTLREKALAAFGTDFSEKRLCGDTSLAVDFYLPQESAIIEVALGLPNPASEYEKDILKAIMAQDFGFSVTRLVFISRAGASKKCDQPGRTAMVHWAASKHHLNIEIHDLPGEPRLRKRGPREAAPSVSINEAVA